MWDITLYLLELTVTLREPVHNQPLAVGNSYHTSLTRLSPQEMIEEVLSNILAYRQKLQQHQKVETGQGLPSEPKVQ